MNFEKNSMWYLVLFDQTYTTKIIQYALIFWQIVYVWKYYTYKQIIMGSVILAHTQWKKTQCLITYIQFWKQLYAHKLLIVGSCFVWMYTMEEIQQMLPQIQFLKATIYVELMCPRRKFIGSSFGWKHATEKI